MKKKKKKKLCLFAVEDKYIGLKRVINNKTDFKKNSCILLIFFIKVN